METERKYCKKVNTNGWMARLQLWAFDIDASEKYVGYCPFFWMTWVCLLCAPFILILKIGESIFDFFSEASSTYFSKDLPSKANNITYEIPYDFVIHNMYLSKKNSEDSWEEYAEKYKEWIAANPTWWEDYHKCEELKEKQKQREQAFQQRKELIINKLSNIIKFLVKPILILSILLVAFLIYKLVFILPWLAIGKFVGTQGILIASILALLFVGKLIAKWIGSAFNFINRNIEDKPTKVVCETKEPGAISKGFHLIGTFFGFIFETIKMTYKKECPLIEWGEESGKITKRTNTNENE